MLWAKCSNGHTALASTLVEVTYSFKVIPTTLLLPLALLARGIMVTLPASVVTCEENGEGKGKIVPVHAMKAGRRKEEELVRLDSSLDAGDWSASHPPPLYLW